MERFHRQLKDALRVPVRQPGLAVTSPMGPIRAASRSKEDSAISSAEMVYGEPLTLPGDFVDLSTPPPDSFMQQLRERMSRFQPPPTRPVPVQQASHQEAALHKAEFVYIRRGAAASSISPLYSGPYRVISSHFTWTLEARTRSCQQIAETTSPRPLPSTASGASLVRQTSGLFRWRNWRPGTSSRGSRLRRPPLGGVVWRESRKKSSSQFVISTR